MFLRIMVDAVGVKVFKFNKDKSRKNKKDGVSSIYVSNFFKQIFIKYDIPNIDHLLMLHTDRGTEFLSKEYAGLQHTFPIKLSMTDGYKPTQNAVAERLNNTFKNQLKYIKPTIPITTPNIQKLQTVINKRVKNFNRDFKTSRNLNLGATLLREFFASSDQDISDTVMTYMPQKKEKDYWLNSDANIIQEYREKVKQNFNLPYDDMEFLKIKIEKVLKQIKDQQDRIELNQHLAILIEQKNHQRLLDYIIQIDKKVSQKPKIKHKPKPLREPINKNIFYQLIQLPKAPHKRYSSYCRFFLFFVILYFTGMRLSEVGDLTEQQVYELQNTQKTQIYASKQNKMIYVVVSKQIQPVLKQIEIEISTTFFDSYQIHQKDVIRHTFNNHTFVAWYNKQLTFHLTRLLEQNPSNKLPFNIKVLSSHSFRINRITQLLRMKMPIEQVQNLIGHANIRTTAQYFRWKPNNDYTIQQLSQIEDQTP